MIEYEFRILRERRSVRRAKGPYSDKIIVDTPQSRHRDIMVCSTWSDWKDFPLVDKNNGAT